MLTPFLYKYMSSQLYTTTISYNVMYFTFKVFCSYLPRITAHPLKLHLQGKLKMKFLNVAQVYSPPSRLHQTP